MILTIAISGYRSLRNLVLPLENLTVVTGGNGAGKSSFARYAFWQMSRRDGLSHHWRQRVACNQRYGLGRRLFRAA
ncbi:MULTISPECIES: hypothetical protein [unclassified Rhizobium]|uniref:hypothetical protein n=1 Tax=unclassified Rhizobium TaxID=2613769 RepID=UPI0031451186